MSGITVIVVPTWAVWLFVGLAVAKIAQNLWHIALLRKQARHEPPNVRANPAAEGGPARSAEVERGVRLAVPKRDTRSEQ